MKKTVIITSLTLMMMASCSDNTVLQEMSKPDTFSSYIEFSDAFVNSQTRTSLGVGKTFSIDDKIGVFGFQKEDTVNSENLLFNNQMVKCIDSINATWTYSPKKFWDKNSTYEFYAYYPYSAAFKFDTLTKYFSLANFTVQKNVADQIDLMVSERNYANAFNTVELTFHHILSNVNIYASLSPKMDMDGITSIDILNFDIKGLKSTGTYSQTGWESNHYATASWTNLSGEYKFPGIGYGTSTMRLTTKMESIATDLLLMPQTLFYIDNQTEDPVMDVRFKVSYADSTSAIITKSIRLSSISGVNKRTMATTPIYEWLPNNKYNYLLTVNPTSTTRIWTADHDGSNGGGDKEPSGAIYDPDQPNQIIIWTDTDGDGKIDDGETEIVPLVWEDIDGDGLLEAGVDLDGDGHIDNVDGDNTTTTTGSDLHNDPTDANNTTGQDGILVYVDTDGDNIPDDWRQLEKDPETGEIGPEKELEEATIEFTALVSDWEEEYDVNYEFTNNRELNDWTPLVP